MAEIDPEDARATLRILRALHGWSQAELAEKAGLQATSAQRYEAGRAIPESALNQFSEAAGVPVRVLYSLLLPTVRYLRDLTGGEQTPGDRRTERERVLDEATRAGEAAAAATRGAFLRAWAEHVQETVERDRNAWRPSPLDREEAIDLWRRMAPHSPAEWEVLLKHGTAFHSWALAEKVAGLAVEALDESPARALELGDLALRVADRVPGSEAWRARIRAYTLAALCAVLPKDREPAAAREAREEAERLWAAGRQEPGPLSEERFQAALERGIPPEM